jgi:molybdate transport system substrate-binding protein
MALFQSSGAQEKTLLCPSRNEGFRGPEESRAGESSHAARHHRWTGRDAHPNVTRVEPEDMTMLARRSLLALSIAGLLAMPAGAQTQPPVIFAAASLKTALDEVASLWVKETGLPALRIAYAGSNALARQIEQGAPADLFLSADLDWMDVLAAKNLIRPETRLNLLGNRIALVVPAESKVEFRFQPGASLAPLLAGGRLSTANVESVPAGKYAKAAFEKLGLWGSVKDHLAQAENVRAALLLVARGEAPLGVVYTTDAAADPKVRILATFPEDSHPPILYPAAIVAESKNPLAARFLEFLRGAGARAVFERNGFMLPTSPRQGS